MAERGYEETGLPVRPAITPQPQADRRQGRGVSGKLPFVRMFVALGLAH